MPYLFSHNPTTMEIRRIGPFRNWPTKAAAQAKFDSVKAGFPGEIALFGDTENAHLHWHNWDYRTRVLLPAGHIATLKPDLPEGTDTSLLSSYIITPVHTHARHLSAHAHDSLRAETSILKDISVSLEAQIDILTRESRHYAAEKARDDAALAALGETISARARALTTASATAARNKAAAEANRAAVEARRISLSKLLWPACFADALIAGLGVAWEQRFGPDGDQAPEGAHAPVLWQNAQTLAAALRTKWQAQTPVPPYSRAVQASRKLVELLEADAARETFNDDGTRSTDDSTRFVPRAYKLVPEFTAATPGRATDATTDATLGQALVAPLVDAAWTASNPPTEG